MGCTSPNTPAGTELGPGPGAAGTGSRGACRCGASQRHLGCSSVTKKQEAEKRFSSLPSDSKCKDVFTTGQPGQSDYTRACRVVELCILQAGRAVGLESSPLTEIDHLPSLTQGHLMSPWMSPRMGSSPPFMGS